MDRRNFLKATGFGAASLVLSSSVPGAEAQNDRILGEADARIQKCRTGDAVLRVLGPDGKPLRAGSTVKITQSRHKFLFGCNIFKLGRCRTPQDNAAYEKRFAAF